MRKRISAVLLLLAAYAISLAQQGELVGEIVVRGNREVPEAVIKNLMQTKVGQVYSPSQLIKDQQALLATGQFQDAKVYGQLLENNKWRVVVEVVEWAPIKVFRITGNTVVGSAAIIGVLKNKVGAVYNPNFLEQDARAIQELYRKDGYFARVNKYEPTLGDPGVVELEVVEARVNKLEITGLTRTRPSVVRRLFDTKSGDLLNYNVLNDDLRRVVDTRWFESINPDTSEPKLGQVDIDVKVKETRTGTFNVGVQLDPRNRLAGLFSLNDNNFNGTGKSVGINLLQSAQGLGTSVTLDYGDPAIDSKRSSLNASIYSREQLVFGTSLFGGGGSITSSNRYAQRRTGAEFNISKVANRDTRISFGLLGQSVSSRDFVVDPGEEFVFQDGNIYSLTLGGTRNRRDFNQDPAKGDFLRVTVTPSLADITSVGGQNIGFDILGQNYYTKAVFDYRSYFSKGPRRTAEQFDKPVHVLATRIYGGTILGKVPFFDQFFIGGANGVRGYAEDRFWGRTALLFQIEYRYPIQKSFNAIGFADYGGAWDGYPGIRNFTQSSSLDLHFGYGVGVNFKTPFGPIRLDIGFDDKGTPRTHFLIGGSF